MECLFCRALPEVSQVDFVHLPEEFKINADMGGIDDKNYGQEDSGEEMVDDKLFLNNLHPLIAYVTYENKT